MLLLVLYFLIPVLVLLILVMYDYFDKYEPKLGNRNDKTDL